MNNSPSPVVRLLRWSGSVQMAMVLLLAGAAIMAVGTVIESKLGRAAAQALVYKTLWFDAYLLLIALNLIVAVVNRIPIQRHQWSFVLTHFAIVLLLVGALMSRTLGYEGSVVIQEGGAEQQLYENASELVISFHDAEGSHDSAAEKTRFEVPAYGDPSGTLLLADGPEQSGLRIVDYIPKGVSEAQLQPEQGADRPGVEITMAGAGWQSSTWLVATHPEHRWRELGAVDVELLILTDPEQFASRISAQPPMPVQVVIETGDGQEPLRLELPAQQGIEVPCGEGVTAKVTRLLMRSRVIDGQLVETADGSPNPAAVVEIRSGGHTETHTVYSEYPKFNSVRNQHEESFVDSITLEGVRLSDHPVLALLAGPDGGLHVQIDAASGRTAATPIVVNVPLDLPSLGAELTVTALYPTATVTHRAVAAGPDEEEASPFVRLQAFLGGMSQTFWMEQGSWRDSLLGDSTLHVDFQRLARPLPFAVELSDFSMSFHPGSESPATYESHVTLRPLRGTPAPLSAVISMNRPVDFMGHRLFQSGFLPAQAGRGDTTILSIANDPGKTVVYIAFVLLIVGVGWYVLGDGRKRPERAAPSQTSTVGVASMSPSDTARSLARSKGAVSVMALAAMTCALAAPLRAADDAPSLPLDKTGGWALLTEGRVKPLETHAREIVLALTGRHEFDGLDSLQIFWGYHFAANEFKTREYIRVDSQLLKQRMDVPVEQRRFSFDAIMRNMPFQTLVEQAIARDGDGKELTPLEQDAIGLYGKIDLAASLMDGRALTLVPGDNAMAAWASPSTLSGATRPEHQRIFAGFVQLAASYQQGQAAEFGAAADGLTRALRAADLAGVYPSADTIGTELTYNSINAFGKSWGLYLLSFVILIVASATRTKGPYYAGLLAIAVGFIYHTVGISLRWMIAGRAPVSDMYESLVFMGWGVAAIGLVLEFVYRKGYFAMCAGLMGFIVLAFSENLPLDSSINPLVPVLANTSWLTIHVMTIMLSYSAFALAMVMAHVTLVMQLYRPGKTESLRSVSSLLYKTLQVGLLFLAAGICFGAVWANESWGRYWGWDPKETWSLITFFIYLALVHGRFAGWLHNFGLSVSAIGSFLSVLMTYYGVNFVLGAGLHSYGFASGGSQWVMLYIGIELAIIAFATLRYRKALETTTMTPLDSHAATT